MPPILSLTSCRSPRGPTPQQPLCSYSVRTTGATHTADSAGPHSGLWLLEGNEGISTSPKWEETRFFGRVQRPERKEHVRVGSQAGVMVDEEMEARGTWEAGRKEED